MAEQIFDRDATQKIGKQIVLPLSRAVEISIKSLKIRFWRSIITVSSIILAIAFLAYILVNTTMVRALKEGPEAELQSLVQKQQELQNVPAAGTADELAWLRQLIAEKKQVRDKLRVALQSEGGSDETEAAELAGGSRDGDAGSGPPSVGGSQRSAIGSFFSEMKATDYWLISLALLVCFVGIVNAMLMSVTERFREIGTMKCLGALDSFIVKLFLLESVFQGALGTVLGIVLGLLLAMIRSWWLYGGPVFTYMPWFGLLLCIVLAQAIGTLLSMLAAVFPARAAARMQPVDALRAEQ